MTLIETEIQHLGLDHTALSQVDNWKVWIEMQIEGTAIEYGMRRPWWPQYLNEIT